MVATGSLQPGLYTGAGTPPLASGYIKYRVAESMFLMLRRVRHVAVPGLPSATFLRS